MTPFVITQQLLFLELFESHSQEVGLFIRPVAVTRLEDSRSYEGWKPLLCYPSLMTYTYKSIVQINNYRHF